MGTLTVLSSQSAASPVQIEVAAAPFQAGLVPALGKLGVDDFEGERHCDSESKTDGTTPPGASVPLSACHYD